MHPLRLLVLLVVCSLFFTAPAAVAAPWSAPAEFSGSFDVIGLAMGPDGTAVAGVQGAAGVFSRGANTAVVQPRSPEGDVPLIAGEYAVYGAGRIVSLTRAPSDYGRLEVADGDLSGAFSAPQVLFQGETSHRVPAELAANAAGDAAVATTLGLRVRRGGEEFGAPIALSPAPVYANPAVAINAAGDVLAAWAATDGGVYAREVFADGRIGVIRRLGDAPPRGSVAVDAALGAGRRGVVAWSWGPCGTTGATMVAYARAGRRFGRARVLDHMPRLQETPCEAQAAAALRPHDAALVAWSARGTPGAAVRASDLAAGRPQRARTLSDRYGGELGGLAGDPQGDALVGWTARPSSGDPRYAAAAVRPAGAHRFGRAEHVSDAGPAGSVLVALDPRTREGLMVFTAYRGRRPTFLVRRAAR